MGGLDFVCLTVFGHFLFTLALPIYITHMYMYWAEFTYIRNHGYKHIWSLDMKNTAWSFSLEKSKNWPCHLPTWQQFRQSTSSPCCPDPHYAGLAHIWLALLTYLYRLGVYSLPDPADPWLLDPYVSLSLNMFEGLGQGSKMKALVWV